MTAADVVAVVAVVVLLGAAVPLLRVLVDLPFRHLFPRPAGTLAVLLAAWLLAVAALAVARPGIVWLAAVPAGLLALFFAWRARPGYGARRRLPPGSLSVTRSVRDLAHRDAYQRGAARHGPVFKSAQFHRPVICIVGLERGQRLLQHHGPAIGASPLPFSQQLAGGFLRYMNDEAHDVYGPLLRRSLSHAVVTATEPVARASSSRHLAGLPTSTLTEPGPVADVEPLLEGIARECVVHALFGLRAGTEPFERFEHQARRLAASSIMHPLNRGALRAFDQQRAIVATQVTTIESVEQEAQLPCALTELLVEQSRPPDDVCVDNLLMMAKIGTENLMGLLRWLLVLLAAEPEWWSRLQGALDDPADGDAPDVFDGFVWETLRLAQSEYLYRRLTDDVEFEGYRLPAGWLVRICVAESHRDPAVFPDPDRLTDRFVGHRPPTKAYCPFGFGRHACSGAGLTMTVASAFLAEVVRAPDLVVAQDGRLTRGPRHWSHWRPAPPIRAWHRARESAGT